jgi:hypothetical protein
MWMLSVAARNTGPDEAPGGRPATLDQTHSGGARKVTSSHARAFSKV